MIDNINNIAILSFYAFATIEKPENLLPKILLIGKKKAIKGIVLIANEGFNGSISGDIEKLNLIIDELKLLTAAEDINIKINYCDAHPFRKLKVKVKKEIISMGIGHLNIEQCRGTYIETQNWDQFIARDDVVLIDTRNDYEVEVGTFKNSINPQTETFREFPAWVQNNMELLAKKKIAMYCTGGIRCEKSTAYLKSLGINEVYHLKGGILQYLQDTKNKSGMWQGECFVFDDRRAVSDDLVPAEGHWLERSIRLQ